MNEAKREAMARYLAGQAARYQELARVLDGDERSDEGIFAKVQMNIYDAFQAVFAAGVKLAGEDDGKLTAFFAQKLEQIPKSWEASLRNAQAHGETEKAHIEQLKLEAAAAIRAEFDKVWRDAV